MPPSIASASSSIKSLSIAFSPPSTTSSAGFSRAPLDPTITNLDSLASSNGTKESRREGKGQAGIGDVIASTEGLGTIGKRKGRVEMNDDETGSRSTEEQTGEEDDADSSEQSKEQEESESEERSESGEPEVEEEESSSTGPDPLEGTTPDEDDDAKSEGADEGSSEEDEEDEEEEDEEPTLKYARLGGSTEGILGKDTASALLVSDKYIVLGSHNGAVYVLNLDGRLLKTFRPHAAMVNDLSLDLQSEFVASASMDGKVAIHSLTTPEAHVFDLQRPMRCVALEPNFSKRSTRQFVSGGMAGSLILSEKGWLGHKETVLYSGEGPIWATEWRGTLIAWASDAGVRVYDTVSSQRITYIARSEDSPRADLFKCSLHWVDDRTLFIAWADFIKVAVVKERETKRGQLGVPLPSSTELFVEVTAIFQVDCMISGIVPYGDSFLILAYLTEDLYDNEATENRDEQRRKAGSRPELRIISKDGEELSSDAIGLRDYARFQCRDYSLCPSADKKSFYVISPKDIVVAQERDESDHIVWLIEQRRYEEALRALEKSGLGQVGGFDVTDVGTKYLQFLVDDGQFDVAAAATPKILGINAKMWEDWVFLFADKGKMDSIVPYVPIHDPQLSRLVYEMILAHFLRHDQAALHRTIQTWPTEIYDVGAVILAIKDQLERTPKSQVLMQSIADLYLLNRQPGKALPYFLKLRDPNVFALIREHNLFTDIQDQALLLIEFDRELQKKREGTSKENGSIRVDEEKRHKREESQHGTAIDLLVDHTHSIPIPRVIAQLQNHRHYLFLYLDALFDKDPHLAFDYSDLQVDLYAEYNASKLMDFLRASNYYSLERAYKICDSRDLVPEMVFLLGRMGDNKRALNLIIERLGDVQRAIDFAKEQNDNDLWEDLLRYSETKPRFIRGLLENVGAEIDPLRLIRRIKNGLEIPGLKPALIKILQDFNLQLSLMEGCKSILYSDCRHLTLSLHDSQTTGFLWTAETKDKLTGESIYPQLAGGPVPSSLPLGIRFLSGETYLGISAFPALQTDSLLSATVTATTKRDQLVAAALLASSDVGDDPSLPARRAMQEKLRLVKELREQLLDQRERERRKVVRVDVV
ncbi:Vps41p [Sporobolomyces salmoneus]|uniref:Vps41p n=1 Tax=Sporobolomyces salmoneus TaxID=183962 RepID=UPI0031760DF3